MKMSPLEKLIHEVELVVSSIPDVVTSTGEWAAMRIRERTALENRFLNEGAPATYRRMDSEEWSRYGKRVKGRVGPVTLSETGEMLKAVTSWNDEGTPSLGYDPRTKRWRNELGRFQAASREFVTQVGIPPDAPEGIRKRAAGHQLGLSIHHRQFIGLTADEQADLDRMMQDAIYDPGPQRIEVTIGQG